MALTTTIISKAKPRHKAYLLKDNAGLFLEIRPNGVKTFYLIYQHNKKQIKKTIGKYPQIDLNQARLKALELRQGYSLDMKFKNCELVALEWLKIKEKDVSYQVYKEIYSLVSRAFIEPFRTKFINEVKRSEILNVIDKLLGNKIETKYRAISNIRQILNYAVVKEYVEYNCLLGIKASEVFGKKKVTNYPTITSSAQIKDLFAKVANSSASLSIKACIFICALSALRIGNVVKLKWSNIDFKNKLFIFNADEMKSKRDFILPINTQALQILKYLYKYYKFSEFVFFGSNGARHINIDNPRILFRRLGYKKDEFTTHSFRSMFSTICNENNKDSEVIELCLAHSVSGVKRVYDRSHKIVAKRNLMTWWGNYLDKLFNCSSICDFKNM